ncbi:MAG: MFS transporter [Lachnospiraceae bacterium]|nr:MFS transporter [Lachnospiraceae bacterium]
MGKTQLTLQERAKKFSPRNTFGYTFYRMSQIMSGYLVTYTTYYATDSLFLAAGMVGILLMVSKCFDGVTDLLAGWVLEHTNTKYGKARPFILLGILSWIGMVMIFLTPAGLSTTGKLAWVFVFYTLDISVFQTLTNIADMPVIRRSIPDETQKSRALGIANIGTILVAMLISVPIPLILERFGSGQSVWIGISVVYGIVGSVLSIVGFLCVREYSDEELVELGVALKGETSKVGVKEMLSSIGNNRYFMVYLLLYALTSLVNSIASVSGTYYFSVNIGNLALMSLTSLIGFVLYPLYLVYPKLIEKWGTAKFFQAVCVVGCVGYAIRGLAGANVPGLMAGTLISGFAAATTLCYTLICMNCMTYGELKTGKSAEGAYAAGQNFVYKVVAGLGSAALGLLLAAGGYDGTLTTQPQSAYFMINFVYNWFPLIAYLLSAVFVRYADPTKEIEKMQKEMRSNS